MLIIINNVLFLANETDNFHVIKFLDEELFSDKQLLIQKWMIETGKTKIESKEDIFEYKILFSDEKTEPSLIDLSKMITQEIDKEILLSLGVKFDPNNPFNQNPNNELFQIFKKCSK